MGRHNNRNSEGFDDPTACEAINRADREIDYRRFKKTMRDLHNICAMNGFAIQGRVVLQDKTNGKVWRWAGGNFNFWFYFYNVLFRRTDYYG